MKGQSTICDLYIVITNDKRVIRVVPPFKPKKVHIINHSLGTFTAQRKVFYDETNIPN